MSVKREITTHSDGTELLSRRSEDTSPFVKSCASLCRPEGAESAWRNGRDGPKPLTPEELLLARLAEDWEALRNHFDETVGKLSDATLAEHQKSETSISEIMEQMRQMTDTQDEILRKVTQGDNEPRVRHSTIERNEKQLADLHARLDTQQSTPPAWLQQLQTRGLLASENKARATHASSDEDEDSSGSDEHALNGHSTIGNRLRASITFGANAFFGDEKDVEKKKKGKKADAHKGKKDKKKKKPAIKKEVEAPEPTKEVDNKEPEKPTQSSESKGQRDTAPDMTETITQPTDVLVLNEVEFQETVEETVKKWPLPNGCKRFLSRTDAPLTRVTRSRLFECLVNLIIFANVMFIGIQAEHLLEQAKLGKQPDDYWKLIDLVFSGAFMLELLMRLIAERASIFLSDDWRWNCFDIFFVFMDALNQLAVSFEGGSVGSRLSSARGALRALRLARAARALRVFRALKVVARVRLLIEEIVASLVLSIYIMIIVCALLVFCSVIFLQATTESYTKNIDDSYLHSHFGTIGQSMLSLFWCLSGALSLTDAYDALEAVAAMYSMFFLFYVFFMLIAFLNVINAVFVAHVLSVSQKHEVAKRDTRDIGKIIKRAVKNSEDPTRITLNELKVHLESPKVRVALLAQGIDNMEAAGVFELLRSRGTREVPLDDYIRVCSKFTRPSRSADIVSLLLANKTLGEDLARLKRWLVQQQHQQPQLLGVM